MRKLLISASALMLSFFPALAQTQQPTGNEVITGLQANWQTLNDNRVCGVRVFYNDDWSLEILRGKQSGRIFFVATDRHQSRNIGGRPVRFDANGTLIGQGRFSTHETFGRRLNRHQINALQSAAHLRVTMDNKITDYSLSGSSNAINWVGNCHLSHPVVGPSVNQRHIIPGARDSLPVIPNFSTQVNPIIR